MKALLIGATGATGSDLMNFLINDDSFSEVTVFVRKPLSFTHNKLTTHLIDFDKPENWGNLVVGDVLFCCLGTTLQAAGSKEAQWKIDHDYQLNFAKAAKKNGSKTCVLVSADMVSEKSLVFYSRMKAHLEKEIKELGFESLHIFRPPLLIRKNTDRKGELIAEKLLVFFNAIGLFKKSKPLKTEILAKAMILSAKLKNNGTFLYTPPQIEELAK